MIEGVPGGHGLTAGFKAWRGQALGSWHPKLSALGGTVALPGAFISLPLVGSGLSSNMQGCRAWGRSGRRVLL